MPSLLPNASHSSATDHVPVLVDKICELLAVRPGETIVDATFGAGGHAEQLASELQGDGRLIAIDRDPDARPYFECFRRNTAVQARFLRGDFAVVLAQLERNGVQADAVLLDLGLSSMQIDRPERGFSYAADAPLDMRMDQSADTSARGLLNEADERDLADIFRRYGEERYARRIAPSDRGPARTRALRADVRARRDRARSDSGSASFRRRSSSEASVPGPSDRSQP